MDAILPVPACATSRRLVRTALGTLGVALVFTGLTGLAFLTLFVAAVMPYQVAAVLSGAITPEGMLGVSVVTYLAGVILSAVFVGWLVRRLRGHGLAWVPLAGVTAFSVTYSLGIALILPGVFGPTLTEAGGFALIMQPYAFLMGFAMLVTSAIERLMRGPGAPERSDDPRVQAWPASSVTVSSSEPER